MIVEKLKNLTTNYSLLVCSIEQIKLIICLKQNNINTLKLNKQMTTSNHKTICSKHQITNYKLFIYKFIQNT